jgi:ABC-type lipoprotein export system ATPase subunit
MSNVVLELHQVVKRYKGPGMPVEVLKGVDLALRQGEFLAIQGPSGAGKSTLLHIMGGIDVPTKGEVLVAGCEVGAMGEGERAALRNRTIGFVFQFYHLLPELTALENVLLPAMLRSWWDLKRASAYAKELLHAVGMQARTLHRPGQLSGGEQQRVAICRALINRPQILLCDEPTGNLDSANGSQILEIIGAFHRKERAAVVMVTHDAQVAQRAHRMVQLKDGMIVSQN